MVVQIRQRLGHFHHLVYLGPTGAQLSKTWFVHISTKPSIQWEINFNQFNRVSEHQTQAFPELHEQLMIIESGQKPLKFISTDRKLRNNHLQELAKGSGHIIMGQVQQKHEEVILCERRPILNDLPDVLSDVAQRLHKLRVVRDLLG